MISTIINFGIYKGMKDRLKQQVRLTNKLLLILMGVTILLLFPILFEDGWAIAAYIDIFSFFLFSFLILLNYFNYNKLCRIITTIYPPIIITIGSIAVKIKNPESVFVYDFLDARILILGFSILPFMFFSSQERKYMFSTFAFCFLLIVAFDPIHSFIGVGYANFFGTMPKAYIVTGIYLDIALIFIAASFFYFLSNIKLLLHKNILLAEELGEKNIELSALFEEMEKLNDGLRKNEGVINKQKNLLEKSNFELVERLETKTKELKQSNKELINHNNELQQFSNTLSHNLRGPVANLLGLAQLFKIDQTDDNRNNVAEHIYKSAEALDGVIKDLNKIVELRNNLFQIKERIDIKAELDNIWLVLQPSVEKSKAILKTELKVKIIYGVRSYFHSILYNLISNAIKYRNTEKICTVKITAKQEKGECILAVEDNGIGVDLNKHGDKIFGMYKRFHTHIEGKGLGLFLAKQQIESMGGRITIESGLNVGTKFILKLPTVPLSKIESQLFYKSNTANIYLDTVNQITTLVWTKMPNPLEFAEVFSNNIEVFSVYNSVKWIIDLTIAVDLASIRKQWILENAIEQYVKIGIKQVAIVRIEQEQDADFWKKFAEITKDKSLQVLFVKSIQEAKEILLRV